MTTEILASGMGEADSSTFDLAEGESATLSLRISSDANTVSAQVQKQGSDSQWYPVGLMQNHTATMVLQAAGTYRVHRFNSGVAYGIDQG